MYGGCSLVLHKFLKQAEAAINKMGKYAFYQAHSFFQKYITALLNHLSPRPPPFLSVSDDLAYEVRWFFTRLRGGETTTQVASVDRFGVVRKEARNSSSDISIERKDTHTYMLNIHGTQDR